MAEAISKQFRRNVMYSFAVIHESRNLKQARINQDVDLLRSTLATPSWVVLLMLSAGMVSVKLPDGISYKHLNK